MDQSGVNIASFESQTTRRLFYSITNKASNTAPIRRAGTEIGGWKRSILLRTNHLFYEGHQDDSSRAFDQTGTERSERVEQNGARKIRA